MAMEMITVGLGEAVYIWGARKTTCKIEVYIKNTNQSSFKNKFLVLYSIVEWLYHRNLSYNEIKGVPSFNNIMWKKGTCQLPWSHQDMLYTYNEMSHWIP